VVKNRLRALLSEREWTQAALAKRLGVSRQTVHAIETGKAVPGLELAFSIARLFGLRVDEVFQPEEQTPRSG
jgi:putative transcriptional regulator